MRRSFCADVDRALHDPWPSTPVAESDLAQLPSTIQRYLRASGAVGHPRVLNMRARMHGRIRSGVAAPWMPFVAEQYSFFGEPARYFYMKASRWLVPVHVYHRYAGTSASMRVKALDLVPVASASGSEMTKAETVTMFNDCACSRPLLLSIPGFTGNPWTRPGRWRPSPMPATRFVPSSSSTLDELVNFWSHDRRKGEADGSMRAVPWSTPMRNYRAFGHARLGSRGLGIWHLRDGPLAYVEIEVDEIAYNIARR